MNTKRRMASDLSGPACCIRLVVGMALLFHAAALQPEKEIITEHIQEGTLDEIERNLSFGRELKANGTLGFNSDYQKNVTTYDIDEKVVARLHTAVAKGAKFVEVDNIEINPSNFGKEKENTIEVDGEKGRDSPKETVKSSKIVLLEDGNAQLRLNTISTNLTEASETQWLGTDVVKISILCFLILVSVCQSCCTAAPLRYSPYYYRRQQIPPQHWPFLHNPKVTLTEKGNSDHKIAIHRILLVGELILFFFVMGAHEPIFLGPEWFIVGLCMTNVMLNFAFGYVGFITGASSSVTKKLGNEEDVLTVQTSYTTITSLFAIFVGSFMICALLSDRRIFLTLILGANVIGFSLLGYLWLSSHIGLLRLLTSTDDKDMEAKTAILGPDAFHTPRAPSPHPMTGNRGSAQRIPSYLQQRRKARKGEVESRLRSMLWILAPCLMMYLLSTLILMSVSVNEDSTTRNYVRNNKYKYSLAFDMYVWMILGFYGGIVNWSYVPMCKGFQFVTNDIQYSGEGDDNDMGRQNNEGKQLVVDGDDKDTKKAELDE
eukprot:jgi/Bigna1/86635/estExt_fgenesh1_pg.C_120114